MKHLLIFLIILNVNYSIGQSRLDTDSLSIEVCNCIDSSINLHGGDVGTTLLECNAAQIAKLNRSVLPKIEEDSELTPYEQGKIFGERVTETVFETMIETCEIWASYMYELREDGLKRMVDYKQDAKIRLIKSELKENDSEKLHVDLGMCYLANGDLENAKEKVQYCLEAYPTSIGSRYFAALYFEYNGQLDVALEAYKTVYEYRPDFSIYTIVALVKRKILLQK